MFKKLWIDERWNEECIIVKPFRRDELNRTLDAKVNIIASTLFNENKSIAYDRLNRKFNNLFIFFLRHQVNL